MSYFKMNMLSIIFPYIYFQVH